MEKIRLGILGTSEIAFRRFMPALQKCDAFEYVGVASRTLDKTNAFIQQYGGIGFDGYMSLIECEDIDAVYIPLPPALHYEWAKKALEHGKHIFMEKPFTTSLTDTEALIRLAKEKGLALHENYMFQFHSQLEQIQTMISEGQIGDVRLYRIAFGFPKRGENDFRYSKELGGGALLDCGGYTVKLASMLLGDTAKVTASHLNYVDKYQVDLYGTVTMENAQGQVAQLAFGMDNCYKCDLEVWGSTGNLFTNRIFTAPVDYLPELIVQQGNAKQNIALQKDDSFFHSIEHFAKCIKNDVERQENYRSIYMQSELIEQILAGGER